MAKPEPAPNSPAVDPQSVAQGQTDHPGIAEGPDIVVVTATKASEIAPVTASLAAKQPQSIVSRSLIEDTLPATADFD